MAKPLKPSVNHSDVPKRSKQFSKCNKVKKVRIICSDPYATESSGDEIESEGATRKIKRCVREIKFCDSLCLNWSSVKKSRKNGKMQKNCILSKAPLTSEGRVLQFFGNSTAKERPNRSLYRGVRQRKSGKWAAEIRNPFEQRRLWLGTYNSPEEASRVYEAKRQEFVSKARNMAKGNSKWSMGEFSDDVASPHFQNQQHVVPEDSEALSQASSPASVLELNTGAVNADFDCDSLPKESADVDTDENNEIVEGCPAADPVQKKAMFMELENTPLDPEIDFQFFDDIRKLDDSSDPHVFPVFDIKLEGEMRLHDNFFDTAEFPPWMDLSRDPWTP